MASLGVRRQNASDTCFLATFARCCLNERCDRNHGLLPVSGDGDFARLRRGRVGAAGVVRLSKFFK